MVRAGFGIRLAAAAIDAGAMYLLNFVASMIVVPFVMLRQGAGTTQQVGSILGVSLLLTGTLWLAYASMELFGSASPAKRLLKLRLASAADHGPASVGRRARRWGLKYLPVVLYVVSMVAMFAMISRPAARPGVFFVLPQLAMLGSIVVVLGGFSMTLGKERRALHDYLGGTVVLRPGQAPQGFAPIMAQPVIPGDPAKAPAPPAETTR